jgi:hypothetical protein
LFKRKKNITTDAGSITDGNGPVLTTAEIIKKVKDLEIKVRRLQRTLYRRISFCF